MGWKDWSSWLKGGIILGLIPLILFIILSSIYLINPESTIGNINNPLFFIIMLFVFMGEGGVGGALLGALIYFIIGAIIGWIVGKIRNR